MYAKIITVTAVNNYIKKVIDNDFILSNSNIKGELSNVKIHSSGHIYFSLKDNFSKINCIMFKSNADSLSFIPRDGMNVVVSGNVSVYEKDGAYQLYCKSMKVEGEGELFIAFQKLKESLEAEGLFNPLKKKKLPLFPRRIGVVTSPTGAAVRDIINVSKRRNKNVDLLIYPALVQGINASEDIVRGISMLNKIEDVDVIIVARGGGSIEELWAFNEEKVARAIASSKKPIVSGIGHETDFTISDFVSDVRGATPSQAAEIVVGSYEEILYKLKSTEEKLKAIMNNMISEKFNRLKLELKTIKLYSPYNSVINEYNKVDNLRNKLDFNIRLLLNEERSKLNRANELLLANNPLKVLSKGYGIIQDAKSNTISSIEELKGNDTVKVLLKDGSATFKIKYLEEQDG
jgi:exodeoxyribonuclease VII large subunit